VHLHTSVSFSYTVQYIIQHIGTVPFSILPSLNCAVPISLFERLAKLWHGRGYLVFITKLSLGFVEKFSFINVYSMFYITTIMLYNCDLKGIFSRDLHICFWDHSIELEFLHLMEPFVCFLNFIFVSTFSIFASQRIVSLPCPSPGLKSKIFSIGFT
jgi:hypothetical protein